MLVAALVAGCAAPLIASPTLAAASGGDRRRGGRYRLGAIDVEAAAVEGSHGLAPAVRYAPDTQQVVPVTIIMGIPIGKKLGTDPDQIEQRPATSPSKRRGSSTTHTGTLGSVRVVALVWRRSAPAVGSLRWSRAHQDTISAPGAPVAARAARRGGCCRGSRFRARTAPVATIRCRKLSWHDYHQVAARRARWGC